MKDSPILIAIASLHAHKDRRAVRRSPVLRVSIHHHAIVMVPWFVEGRLLGFSLGTLGEQAVVFSRSDPFDDSALVSMCSDASDIFSEYFARSDDAGIHPQIVIPSDSSGLLLGAFSRNVSHMSGDFPAREIERARHFGRLLGYALVERLGFPGQQSLISCSNFVDDHFALPLFEENLDDPRIIAALLRSEQPPLNPDASSYLNESLANLHSSKTTSDSGGIERAEHTIKTVVLGELLSRHSGVNSAILKSLDLLPRKAPHLQALFDLERSAFQDYMLLLSHHMRRIRRLDAIERESVAPQFFSMFERPLMKIRREASRHASRILVDDLMLQHDPVSRSSGRLAGLVLSSRVERCSPSLVVLIAESLPPFVFPGSLLKCLEGGEGVVRKISGLGLNFRITLAWSGPSPSSGSSLDFSDGSVIHPVSEMLSLVDNRLGRRRGGEPWTHREDAPVPSSIFHPHRENLTQHLSDLFQ